MITTVLPDQKEKTLRTIRNGIKHGDCLVFIYKKKDDVSVGTRFVTPLAVDEPTSSGKDHLVRTKQHFPVDGYRNFSLSRIISVQRVIPVADL